MDILTLGSLKFVWDFISPILSDSVKERLKPNGSAETAKRLAFALYKALGEVNQGSDAFVQTLEQCAALAEKDADLKVLRASGDELVERAMFLKEKLRDLLDALEAVNPQFEIHNEEAVEQIRAHYSSRMVTVTTLEEVLSNLIYSLPNADQKAQLRMLATQADENRKSIHSAIENTRTFLEKEFPFKESF